MQVIVEALGAMLVLTVVHREDVASPRDAMSVVLVPSAKYISAFTLPDAISAKPDVTCALAI